MITPNPLQERITVVLNIVSVHGHEVVHDYRINDKMDLIFLEIWIAPWDHRKKGANPGGNEGDRSPPLMRLGGTNI